MITVDNLNILKKLKNHEDGETVFVSQEKLIFRYNAEKDDWEIASADNGFSVNMYDLNKQKYLAQKEEMPDEILVERVTEFLNQHTNTKYFMILNHEYRYYTMIVKTNFDSALNSIISETLSVIDYIRERYGSILKDCVLSDNDMLEIWISNGSEVNMFPLFDYDMGVIECH